MTDDMTTDERFANADTTVAICSWFAMCGRVATGARWHPILSWVAICERCTAIVDDQES